MYDIRYLIKEMIEAKSVQGFINDRYHAPETKIFDREFLRAITTITMDDGNIFASRPDISMVEDSYTEYTLRDMRPDDVVLDIGANVGGFSLRSARKADFVYAVEPVQYDALEHNIALNNLDNIEVMKCGVGNGTENVTWKGTTQAANLFSLAAITKRCDKPPSFLKIDCEGCEHMIESNDFAQFRHIIGEIHNFDGTTPKACFINTLRMAGFEVEITGGSKFVTQFTAYKV